MRRPTPVRRFPIPTRIHPTERLIPLPARRRAWYHTPAVVASLLVFVVTLTFFFIVPFISKCDPLAMDQAARLQSPSLQYSWDSPGGWGIALGADQFGRDVACRALYGAHTSLGAGTAAMLIAVLPGLWLGLLAGYYGGWVDVIIGSLADVLLAFPGLLLALLVVAWVGPGLNQAMLAVGLTGIPRYIRLARSSVLHLKRAWFVRAARIIGCSDGRILTHHLLPNMLVPLIALATTDVAWAILNAAMLSFLGLGAPPPTPEWGAMINEGRGLLRSAPWISLVPGAMMTLTVFEIGWLGDELRRALNPKI